MNRAVRGPFAGMLVRDGRPSYEMRIRYALRDLAEHGTIHLPPHLVRSVVERCPFPLKQTPCAGNLVRVEMESMRLDSTEQADAIGDDVSEMVDEMNENAVRHALRALAKYGEVSVSNANVRAVCERSVRPVHAEEMAPGIWMVRVVRGGAS